MGIYSDQVVPRVIDWMLGNEKMNECRSRSVDQISGVVCEIGFGSGPNVPLYPASVERVYAIDPSPVAWRLAADRVARSPIPIESVGLEGEALPLSDESVDSVLSTWTLCTIPDVDQAMAEIRRILRPGGRFVFLEHGLSDDPRVAHRQHRLNPIQKRLVAGCHLDRDITAIVGRSGLDLAPVARFQIAGPKPMSAMYAGTATKTA